MAGGGTYVNPGLASLCGFDSPDELLEHTAQNWGVIFADPEEFVSLCELLGQKGVAKDFVAGIRRKNGSVIRTSHTLRCLCDKNVDQILAEGFIQPLEADSQMESPALYSIREESILDGMRAGLMLVDPETRIIQDVNAYAAMVIGLPREKIVGQSCRRFFCSATEEGTPPNMLLSSSGLEVSVVKTTVPVTKDGRSLLLASFMVFQPEDAGPEAFKHIEARYQAIIEEQLELICRVTTDGFLTYVNPAFCAFWGKKAGELLYTKYLDMLPHDVQSEIRAQVRDISVEAPLINSTVAIHGRQGDIRWLEWNIRGIFNDTGELIEYQAVGRDMTESILASRRVEHLNTVLKGIREVNRLIIQAKDADSLIGEVCKKLVQARGYYHAWVALLDRQGRFVKARQVGMDEVKCQLAGIFEPGQGPPCLSGALEADGLTVIHNPSRTCVTCLLSNEYKERSAFVAPLRCSGRTHGVLGVSAPRFYADDQEERELFEDLARDLAFGLHGLERERSRRDASEALMQSLDLNRTMAGLARVIIESDSMPDIAQQLLNTTIHLTGSDIGVAGFVSPAGRDLVRVHAGYEMEQGRGNRSWRDEVMFSAVKSVWDQVVESKRPVIDDQGPLRVLAAPALSGDDHLLGVLAIASSEKDFNHEDLKVAIRLSDLLGIAVGRLLMEAELHRAMEAAEVANEAKTHFLANMSHELRTPLNGIMGMVYLAMEEELPEPQREYWETTRASVRTLSQIVNNLLDLSSLDTGSLQPREKPFKLRELVQSLLAAYSLMAESKGLKLLSLIDSKVPELIHGDELRLRQILNNLLQNAIRHTERGEVSISVEKLPQVSSGGAQGRERITLLFSIRDSGPGIPEQRLESVFDSFSLTEHYLTKSHSGAGLGLSLCKRLVEFLGGEIWVKSTPDMGCTFVFTVSMATMKEGETAALQPEQGRFIAKTPAAAPIAAPAPPIGKSKGTIAPHGSEKRLTILVAEDDAVNRELLTRILKRENHRLISVVNGEQALQELFEVNFDLLLLDVQMPVLDGIQVARQVRAGNLFETSPDVPIIALTGWTRESEWDMIRAAGVNEVLSKPYDVAELLEIIRKLV